jgi:hypothetical protein
MIAGATDRTDRLLCGVYAVLYGTSVLGARGIFFAAQVQETGHSEESDLTSEGLMLAPWRCNARNLTFHWQNIAEDCGFSAYIWLAKPCC